MENIFKKIQTQVKERASHTTIEFFLKKNFKYYDTKEDGFLDSEYFKRALTKCGIYLDKTKLNFLLKKLQSVDQTINYEDFIDMVVHLNVQKSVQNQNKIYSKQQYYNAIDTLKGNLSKVQLLKILQEFQIEDQNDNHKVNLNEFIYVMQKFDQKTKLQDLKIAFNAVDQDLDNKISYMQFLKVLAGQVSHNQQNVFSQVFKQLARQNTLERQQFKSSYQVQNHPDVQKRQCDMRQVYDEFVQGVDAYFNYYQINQIDQQHFETFLHFYVHNLQSQNYICYFLSKIFGVDIQPVKEEQPNSNKQNQNPQIQFWQKQNDQGQTQVLSTFKEQLNQKGLLLTLNFFRSLMQYKGRIDDQVPFKLFIQQIQFLKLKDFSMNQMNQLFRSLQNDDLSKFLDINNFIKVYLGQIQQNRKQAIVSTFESLDFKNQKKIDLKDLSNLYKPVEIPQNYIKEYFANLFDPTYFLSCVNEYVEIYKIKDSLNQVQFLDFYQHVSQLFQKDEDFLFYITNTWKNIRVSKRDLQNNNRSNKYSLYSSTPYDLNDKQYGKAFIGEVLDKSKISHKLSQQGYYAGLPVQQKTNLFQKKKMQQESLKENIQENQTQEVKTKIEPQKLLQNFKLAGGYKALCLYNALKKIDHNRNYKISLDSATKEMNKIYLKQKDCVQLLEQFSQNNEIHYNVFFDYVKVDVSQFKHLVEQIYQKFCFNSNLASFSIIKNKLRLQNDLTIKTQKKEKYEIYQSFMDQFELFCLINNINKNKGFLCINFEQFMEFLI